MEQDGLHIVAGGVGGGDEAGPRLPGGLAEEGVAHIPGGLLNAGAPQAGLTGHIARAGVKGDGGEDGPVPLPVPAAAQLDKLLHKALVPVGLRPPEPVVVVGGGQAEAELFPQAVEDVEHGHRVRPAPGGIRSCSRIKRSICLSIAGPAFLCRGGMRPPAGRWMPVSPQV